MTTWDEIRKSAWWSFGAAVGSLAGDAVALGINIIVVARNGVRLLTAETHRAAMWLREQRR